MMSTLLPAHLAPPMDEHTRTVIKNHIARSSVHVVNGELIVRAPGARVTFARRDAHQCGPRSLTAATRFVLTGIPLPPAERAYQRSVIIGLFDIASAAFRENAPKRIADKYSLTSFVTRLTYQSDGGIVSNHGPAFRATGQVKVNDQVVDLLMEILS
jgi:hypothetical protein